jgi:hypothetical protein
MNIDVLPEFNSDGDLPAGLHSATVTEIERRFGRFMISDRRVGLFEKFKQMAGMAKTSGIVEKIIIGGSFVTAKPEPHDIVGVIVLSKDVDFDTLTPSQYVIADRDALRRVLRGGDLDVIVVRESSQRMQTAIEFFQTNRDNKEVGIVEVKL